jgi:hypothetical protein
MSKCMKMYGTRKYHFSTRNIGICEKDLANRANNHFANDWTGESDTTMMLVRNALESIVILRILKITLYS